MFNKYREPFVVRKVAPYKIDGLYIIPSRAFCSDENQGLPIILLTKHFGTFPFNHGRVGGLLAIDRHGPFSHHGDDLVIVQASHVGYDPDTGQYGEYHRPTLSGNDLCVSCGKLTHVITPYIEQYNFAKNRTFLHRDENGRCLLTTKNMLVNFGTHPVEEGLVLKLSNIVDEDGQGNIRPVAAGSTTQTYEVSTHFKKRLDDLGYEWKSGRGECIGNLLTSDLFYFKVDFHEVGDSLILEKNLIEFMPDIVSAKYPPLRAAKTHVQIEFTRVLRSIRGEEAYRGRNLLYITGVNIDISERDGFPPTNYFVPWAAHVQLGENTPEHYQHPLEQDELFAKLMEQSPTNPDQADLKENIKRMLSAPPFDIRVK